MTTNSLTPPPSSLTAVKDSTFFFQPSLIILIFFRQFVSLQTFLLWIVGELAGGGSVAVAVGRGDKWNVIGDRKPVIVDRWQVTRFYDIWHVTCDMWHSGAREYCLKIKGPLLKQFGSNDVMCYVTCDTWQVTGHLTGNVTWYVSHDAQKVVNIVSKFQVLSSQGWGVMMLWRLGGKGWVTKLMNR